ncbi:hypothetical protein LIER_19720 [Lithospermum erythrorhizon]|uniref:Secreted protein n=1 Tax=Lithospermum erythrorhizon TaxID=34254 RepID=A0AAV3QPB5_LITER
MLLIRSASHQFCSVSISSATLALSKPGGGVVIKDVALSPATQWPPQIRVVLPFPTRQLHPCRNSFLASRMLRHVKEGS